MHEIVVNLHMHTRYSDGGGSHAEIARAAWMAGLDVVIITDHNVRPSGMDAYFGDGERRVLLLVGEEVHDRWRDPQKNHLLVLGAGAELAAFADDREHLLSRVSQEGGIAFIAHPDDPAARAFHEPDISWEDDSLLGITGLELWNGFSELKSLIPTRLHGIFYAFFPSFVAHAPLTRTLDRWDRILAQRPFVAIGGSDAHAMSMRLGPLRRIVFPYGYHFSAINTHVLLSERLTGDAAQDARAIYSAFAAGHCFVGYDLAGSTRGFAFAAHGPGSAAGMGDSISAIGGVTLKARLPEAAHVRLIKDGKVVRQAGATRDLELATAEAGVYRVEAYKHHRGRRRGWIFSNPIYLR